MHVFTDDIDKVEDVQDDVSENELLYTVEDIKHAIQQLPNGYRTVLSLHLLEGYDHEEIAHLLQVAHVTVRTQYIRAKQKLIHLLKTITHEQAG
jgi:RNA polymerase sigma factor (sigma-70 family)